MMQDKEAYTVAEVAAMIGFSRNTVIRMFEGERAVMILSHPELIHKRRYRSIRIPRAVYQRVVDRLKVK